MTEKNDPVGSRQNSESATCSEQLFHKAVIESIPGAFYLLDEQGRYVRWNAYQRDEIIGLPEDRVAGFPAINTIHPDDRGLIQARITNVLKNNAVETVEGRVLLRGGPAFRWLLMTGRKVTIDGSSFLIGIGIDITDRKQMEEGLRESEVRYRTFIDANPDMAFLKDDSLRYLISNPANSAFLGKPETEVLGHTDHELMPAAVAGHCQASDRKALLGTGPVMAEETAGAKSYQIIKFPVPLAGGHVGVGGYIRDVTAGKRSEAELRNSRLFIERIINSIPVRVFWKDRDLKYLGCNTVFARDAGFEDQKDLIGKDDFQMGWRDQAELYRSDDLRVIQSGRPKLLIEEPQTTPDGKTIYLLTSKMPLHSATGEIIGLLGTYMNITEHREAANDRDKLQEQLRQSQKMELVGRLAGGVAHDFNNLLTAINGYAGFLLKGLAPEDPKRADVKEIITAAERATVLTKQLLAFSRKQILNPQVIDLNVSVGGMVKMLQRLIGEDIKLKTTLAQRPCRIKVDPGQMDQVIVNLAINARDAMRNGGTLTVETGVISPDGTFSARHPDLPHAPLICLTVRDTGHGMTDEMKAHLFEPFYTTKEKGKGTGLGLSTVFGIIKQSGGEIEVESTPEMGTAFRIYLPCVDSETRDMGRDKANFCEKDKDVFLRGTETVLLVEDEESLRRLGERLLQICGYAVLSAPNGKEALEAVERHGKPVDLLMTDVIMPGMSGRELAAELARRKLARRTLFMSGYTDDAIVQHGVLEPGIAFIYKPFTIEALSVKLREVLDGPADKARA